MTVLEAEVDRLMRSDLVIREQMIWKRRSPADSRVRLRLSVANSLGESVFLHMHMPIERAWQYNLALVWSDVPIRRLDVRCSHRNVCDGSDERWSRQTHKHLWRDQFRDAWAYTPTDIPATPGVALGQDEHRRVFEAFCVECHITVATSWVDPPLQVPTQRSMGTGAP